MGTFIITLLVVGIVVIFVVRMKKKEREKQAKEEQEKREREEEAQREKELREKERKEKYKQNILSGAISYENEIQQIADKLSKYRVSFRDKASEVASLMREFANKTSTGSWDTVWYDVTANKIKDARLESPPSAIATKLDDLREIKDDARIKALADENETLRKEHRELESTLTRFQFSLRM
jgi:DNA repair exonuclease SbcCD ATPase subunit